MSSKARLCEGCGRWAEEGVWVEDDEFPGEKWWVHKGCVHPDEDVLDPQPPPPPVTY